MAATWFVGRNGERSGPFSDDQMRQMAAAGQVRPTDLVWKEGLAGWVPLSSMRELLPVPAGVPGVAVNPYASPAVSDSAAAYSPVSTGGGMQYAEYMPRVGAYLLDMIFINLMTCIPQYGLIFGIVALAGQDRGSQEAAMLMGQFCGLLVAIAISLTYCVTLETSAKQGTWGKQIVGIKVTDLQGRRITVGQAVGRYFAKIITGCTCGVGLLMPLWTEKKQTLHDMMAGCLALNK